MRDRIRASVGTAISERKPAKNNQDDINLIREMLRANGYNVRPDGKMEAGLEKAIIAVQRKAGLKSPDGVVDPGAKTFRYLLPKYQTSQKKRNGGADQFNVKFRGKTYPLDPRSKAEVEAHLFKAITPGLTKIITRFEMSMSYYEGYLATAALKEGVADAIMQVLSISIARVDWPKNKTVSDAQKAISALRRASRARNIEATRRALLQAEPAVNAFYREMSVFHAGIVDGAGKNIKILEFTSDVSFEIFEALATAALVPYANTNADNVAASSKAFLKSTADQLGKYLAGQDVDPKWAAASVVFETAFAGLASYLGKGVASKLNLDALLKSAGPKLAKFLRAKKFPITLTNRQAENLMKNYIKGAASAALDSAVSEAFGKAKELAKKGKSITAKDILDAISDAFTNIASAAIVGSFWKFQKRVPEKVSKQLSRSYAPSAISLVLKRKKWTRITNKQQEEAIAKALKSIQKEIISSSTRVAANYFVDNPHANSADPAVAAALSDKQLLVQFDSALEKALEASARTP